MRGASLDEAVQSESLGVGGEQRKIEIAGHLAMLDLAVATDTRAGGEDNVVEPIPVEAGRLDQHLAAAVSEHVRHRHSGNQVLIAVARVDRALAIRD